MNQKYCGFRVKSAEWVLSLFSLSVGLVIIFSPPDFCVCDNTLHLLYLLSVAKYKYSHSTLHQSPRCRFPKSPARTARTYTQRTLMQPRANTQTCPTLHLFTFYYLRPSLSSILPSPVCPSFSSFFSDLIMLIKPIKSLAARWVNATVSSGHKDTFKHGAERRSEGRGGGKKGGMKGKRKGDKEEIEGEVDHKR